MEQLVAACAYCKEIAVEITAKGDGWKEAQCASCGKLWFIDYANKREGN